MEIKQLEERKVELQNILDSLKDVIRIRKDCLKELEEFSFNAVLRGEKTMLKEGQRNKKAYFMYVLNPVLEYEIKSLQKCIIFMLNRSKKIKEEIERIDHLFKNNI